MRYRGNILEGEEGYVMIATLILLALLTVLGFSITRTTSVDIQIAGNEKVHRKTFYAADGGTQIAAELTEQNLGCVTGFAVATLDDDAGDGKPGIRVDTSAFWMNADPDPPTDTFRDFYYPDGSVDLVTDLVTTRPHTSFTVGGNTKYSTGSAIQMVSGYEGKGKGGAAGGAHIVYDIYTQHLGDRESETVIHTRWRHVIGQEGDCNY